MPFYEFQNPDSGETIEVFQNMKGQHVYFDSSGKEWRRVFSVPAAKIDSNVDPFSKEAFMKATATKGMTVGDMMDLSGELSKKRERSKGLDPVKDKTVTKYEKKTGKSHPLKSK